MMNTTAEAIKIQLLSSVCGVYVIACEEASVYVKTSADKRNIYLYKLIKPFVHF